MQTILVAGDEAEVRRYFGQALASPGFEFKFPAVGETTGTRIAMEVDGAEALLLDLAKPFQDGFQTLREFRSIRPDFPVIAFSSTDSPRDIVRALRHGANDFLTKPETSRDFVEAIARVLPGASKAEGSKGDEDERFVASHFLAPQGSWSGKIELLLDRASDSIVPLLLRGETGVGKEVVARRFHERSPRSRAPFLKINCAALPSDLIESELFGYERGAFTGAFKNTPGKFELAQGGTILLDEIGDMDVRLQAKLLHVLQDNEFMRIGAQQVSRVDVRIMAATHRDLETAISQGSFREDLFYRLNIIDVHIPPLRERCDEILPLAELFLSRHAMPESPAPEITIVLQKALLDHDWPGNIRELENVMRKFLILRNPDWIAGELTSQSRRRKPRLSGRAVPAVGSRLQELSESSIIRNALNAAQWDREKAAKLLSMDADALGNRMRELAIQYGPVPVTDAAEKSSHSASSILSEVDEARRAAESEAILAALNSSHWNRKQAAATLGIDYKALLYKMKKLAIGNKPPEPARPSQAPAAEAAALPEKRRFTAS
jgi:two-component system response regulator AtoC